MLRLRAGRRLIAAPATLVIALAAASPAAGAVPTFTLGPDGEPMTASTVGATTISRFDDLCPGDFDGDGHQDVATGFRSLNGANSGGAIAYGDGTGRLSPFVRAATTQSVGRCSSGDLNGDGLTDLVIAEGGAGDLQVVLGRTDRAGVAAPVGTGAPTTDLDLGDADGDGRLDVFLLQTPVGGNTTRTTVLLGDGAGGLTELPGARTTAEFADDLRAGDLNGDDRDDAVVLTTSVNDNVQALLASLSGAPGAPLAQSFDFDIGELADVNGDQVLDLVGVNGGNYMQVAVGGGSGMFAIDPTLYGGPTAASRPANVPAMAMGDADNDGDADVLGGDSLGSANGFSNLWVKQDTGGGAGAYLADSWAGPFTFLGAQLNSRSVAPVDLDGDGRLDVAIGMSQAGRFAVLLNTTQVPAVRTGAPSAVGSTTATVGGSIDPNGAATQYGVELVSPAGSTTRLPVAGTVSAGAASEPVTAALDNLSPDTAYRYRLFATSSQGSTVGPIRTLRTTVAAPTAVAPPQVSGVAQAGSDLTCSPGTFTGAVTRTYAWLRGGVLLTDATEATYRVRAADVGQLLSCRVTATNPGGSTASDSPGVIAVAAPVVPAPQTPETPQSPQGPGLPSGGAVRIAGPAVVGRSVACAAGDWTAGGRFAYAWLRAGVPIEGATDAAYTPSAAGRRQGARLPGDGDERGRHRRGVLGAGDRRARAVRGAERPRPDRRGGAQRADRRGLPPRAHRQAQGPARRPRTRAHVAPRRRRPPRGRHPRGADRRPLTSGRRDDRTPCRWMERQGARRPTAPRTAPSRCLAPQCEGAWHRNVKVPGTAM
jgi:hypothetical protein